MTFQKNRELLKDYEDRQGNLVNDAHSMDEMINSVEDKISQPLTWGMYDENQSDFSKSFKSVLDDHADLNDFLTHRFPNRKDLTLIEVGGPGYQLRHTLSSVGRSFAVCLEDKDLSGLKSRIPEGSHTVISRINVKGVIKPADLTDPHTFRELSGKMQKKKADVLIERLWGGWANIEKNPNILFHILKKYYKLMAENSVMFVQLMDFEGSDIEEFKFWITLMNQKFSTKLNIVLAESEAGDKFALKIERFPGSPDNLELIN
jgi:hypothetical protein